MSKIISRATLFPSRPNAVNFTLAEAVLPLLEGQQGWRENTSSQSTPDNTTNPEPVPPVSASGKMTYTCHMHPEVRKDHPGDCPKCGMALEPLHAPSGGDAGENAELVDMTRRLRIGNALRFRNIKL